MACIYSVVADYNCTEHFSMMKKIKENKEHKNAIFVVNLAILPGIVLKKEKITLMTFNKSYVINVIRPDIK